MHLPTAKEFCMKLDRLLDKAIENEEFDNSVISSQTTTLLSDLEAIVSGDFVTASTGIRHSISKEDEENIENIVGTAVYNLGDKLRDIVTSPSNISVLRAKVSLTLYNKPENKLDASEKEHLALFMNSLINRLRTEAFGQNDSIYNNPEFLELVRKTK